MSTGRPKPISTTVGEETLISRSTSLLAAPVREETVMMSEASGRYFGLDDIGSDIWRRLETPRTFGELVEALVADYEADPAVIADDLRKLVSEMAAHDVVKLGPQSADD